MEFFLGRAVQRSSLVFSKYTAGLAQQRQRQEREAERRQHRERDGGERER
jgi:hypothetical protein